MIKSTCDVRDGQLKIGTTELPTRGTEGLGQLSMTFQVLKHHLKQYACVAKQLCTEGKHLFRFKEKIVKFLCEIKLNRQNDGMACIAFRRSNFVRGGRILRFDYIYCLKDIDLPLIKKVASESATIDFILLQHSVDVVS